MRQLEMEKYGFNPLDTFTQEQVDLMRSMTPHVFNGSRMRGKLGAILDNTYTDLGKRYGKLGNINKRKE